MKIIGVCLLIILVMFLGNSIYYRSQAEEKFAGAINLLDNDPLKAYEAFDPLLSYNNLLTLGKISECRSQFLSQVQAAGMQRLGVSVPSVNDVDHARGILTVLTLLQSRHGIDTVVQRRQLLEAVRDAMPRIRADGTLSAWDALLALAQNLDPSDDIVKNVFADFPKWIGEVQGADRRPLGLRDAIEKSTQCFETGVKAVKLTLPLNGEFMVQPLPPNLDPHDLIDADQAFSDGMDAISEFQQLFRVAETPPELTALKAKLIYNKGALKTAHLQDLGASGRRMVSAFIAKLIINPGASAVPTTDELYSVFIQAAAGDLRQARIYFEMPNALSPPMKNAFTALSIWTTYALTAIVQQPDERLRSQAQQLGREAAGEAQAIVEAMTRSPRPMIIVQFP